MCDADVLPKFPEMLQILPGKMMIPTNADEL